ncbi:MAG: ORF6N domain-containing protein [Legionellales bacterium]|nr:ORF6N domain-containing protein [Legionellales bacterium]
MDIIKYEQITDRIIEVRHQKVILDNDVAELYGVETKRINEAVSRNPEKFPQGYLIELTQNEWMPLKSQIATSIKGGKVKLPTAFTERGLYMLATILKSERATATTLAIIEAFAKLREITHTIKQVQTIEDENQKKKTLQRTGELITELLDYDSASDESETTIELNFAVLKLKHTIKKNKKK